MRTETIKTTIERVSEKRMQGDVRRGWDVDTRDNGVPV